MGGAREAGWQVIAVGLLMTAVMFYVFYLATRSPRPRHDVIATMVIGHKDTLTPTAQSEMVNLSTVVKEASDEPVKVKYCHLYDGSLQGNEKAVHCMSTRTNPSYTVCPHDNPKDIHASGSIRRHPVWDPGMFIQMQHFFFRDQKMHFIDIGANIGVCTLGVAKMGHRVVAVEPYTENVRRLYKAATKDGTWERIRLVQNAVADRRGIGVIRLLPNNSGNTWIQMGNVQCLGTACNQLKQSKMKIASIFVDDLLEVIDFDRAIMKIDIQGYEHRAFAHASNLLDQVFIPVIIMKWELFTEKNFRPTISPSEDRSLIQKLINLLTGRDYQPFSTLKARVALRRKDWNHWPAYVFWKHSKCC